MWRLIEASGLLQRFESLKQAELCLLVRKEMLASWDSVVFPHRRRSGCIVADVALIDGGVVRVGCVHLQSGLNERKARLTQLHTALAFIDPWRSSSGLLLEEQKPLPNCMTPQIGEPSMVLLCGDFNCGSSGRFSEENAELLQGSCFEDMWLLLRPGEDGFTEDLAQNGMLRTKRQVAGLWFSADDFQGVRGVRYDRILARCCTQKRCDLAVCRSIDLLGTAAVDADNMCWPSDHFGLLVDVEMERTEQGENGGESGDRTRNRETGSQGDDIEVIIPVSKH
jgi:endonuclease/exonuclease/phosphatase family metal-dependent hydrolase